MIAVDSDFSALRAMAISAEVELLPGDRETATALMQGGSCCL